MCSAHGAIVKDRYEHLKSEILNAAWWVRHYRGSRNRTKRAQAILLLGLTCREAFNSSDDYEKLFKALIDGLSTEDREVF